MSTENLPVRWEEQLAKEAKEVAKLETPQLAKISLQAGVMQYQGIVVPENKLRAIILAMGFERRYDTKPYDPGNISPPDCFALSLDDSDDTAPWPTIEVPQNDKCISCAQNSWQPNPRRPGKNHKPCKERRRLILIPEKAVEGNIIAAEMAMLTVPVTSIKFWGQYVNLLSASYRRPPWAMVTEIAVTPDPKNQFQVKFTAISAIGEEYLGELNSKRAQATEAVMVPWDVVPLEKQKAAAPAKENTKY